MGGGGGGVGAIMLFINKTEGKDIRFEPKGRGYEVYMCKSDVA